MSSATQTMPADSVYFRLVHEFPLRTLRNDEDLDRAIAVINGLLDHPELSSGQDDYLAVLARLVEDYEAEHVHLPDVGVIDVIRHLMEANELDQSDLVAVFGTAAAVADVLSGTHTLTLSQIQRLSAFFKLPADVFIDAPE